MSTQLCSLPLHVQSAFLKSEQEWTVHEWVDKKAECSFVGTKEAPWLRIQCWVRPAISKTEIGAMKCTAEKRCFLLQNKALHVKFTEDGVMFGLVSGKSQLR